jgi:hypothetical protein
MLDYTLDANAIVDLDGDCEGLGMSGRDVVKAMIHGRKPGKAAGRGLMWQDPRDYLFEIVANKETGACVWGRSRVGHERATACATTTNTSV